MAIRLRDYLGEEGLGCFLSGDYARDDAEAGMLGYIQSADAEFWASQIESKLSENDALYQVIENARWRPRRFPRGPAHGFVSLHERKAIGKTVTVYHSLLSFVALSPTT